MLNLLPPQDKELLRLEQTRARIIILGNTIVLALLALAVILFSIKINLVRQLESSRATLGQKEAVSSEALLLETEMRKLNLRVGQFNQFYRERKLLLPSLLELSQTLPEGIALVNLTYQKDRAEISLAGSADSREVLLQFKKNLEENPTFLELYFPPSVWIKSKELDFTTTLKLSL